MYFDLEYIPACNPLVDGEIMVTILLNLVRMGLRRVPAAVRRPCGRRLSCRVTFQIFNQVPGFIPLKVAMHLLPVQISMCACKILLTPKMCPRQRSPCVLSAQHTERPNPLQASYSHLMLWLHHLMTQKNAGVPAEMGRMAGLSCSFDVQQGAVGPPAGG